MADKRHYQNEWSSWEDAVMGELCSIRQALEKLPAVLEARERETKERNERVMRALEEMAARDAARARAVSA